MWHADIVQKALIGIGVFAIGSRCPDDTWYRIDDLTKLVFALPNGPRRLWSIINIDFISLVSGGTAYGWRNVALPRFRLLASRPFAACSGARAQCLHQSSDLQGRWFTMARLKQGFTVRKIGFGDQVAQQQFCTSDVAFGSFATEPAGPARQLMSAFLQKRLTVAPTRNDAKGHEPTFRVLVRIPSGLRSIELGVSR